MMEGKMNLTMAAAYPSVYAVKDEYQICVLVNSECIMWVEIGKKKYYDHSNGILRSGKFVHMVHVPRRILDGEKKYRVYLQRIPERKPYYTECGDVESEEYDFRPLETKGTYHIVNLADAHSLVEAPIRSGSYFDNELDLLIMNGDIPNHSGDIENFKGIYLISGAISKGRVPCIFARGNHDMRGIYGEQLVDYTPTDAGKSYYTFRLGPIWGIVLDTGEDKADGRPEYGPTICCEAFREEEEEFLNAVLAAGEYRDVPVRLIISHYPFAFRMPRPFDIEQERYARWTEKLRQIKPTLWLCGHLHECFLEAPGGAHDTYGYPCPLVCSSYYDGPGERHTSGAVTLTHTRVKVQYVTEQGKVLKEEALPLD